MKETVANSLAFHNAFEKWGRIYFGAIAIFVDLVLVAVAYKLYITGTVPWPIVNFSRDYLGIDLS